MRYEQINRFDNADYASIAHGMPEYRVLSYTEIDNGVALARQYQGQVYANAIRSAWRWVSGLFGRRSDAQTAA
ncbi:RSP_7527 family protein [Minwuia sp.]|uniref:RSP_7527 family protein n=1 Tax=Minwuia sp. TaxID=2493630 RepID=UPI003A940C60